MESSSCLHRAYPILRLECPSSSSFSVVFVPPCPTPMHRRCDPSHRHSWPFDRATVCRAREALRQNSSYLVDYLDLVDCWRDSSRRCRRIQWRRVMRSRREIVVDGSCYYCYCCCLRHTTVAGPDADLVSNNCRRTDMESRRAEQGRWHRNPGDRYRRSRDCWAP